MENGIQLEKMMKSVRYNNHINAPKEKEVVNNRIFTSKKDAVHYRNSCNNGLFRTTM